MEKSYGSIEGIIRKILPPKTTRQIQEDIPEMDEPDSLISSEEN